jgi:hypothetical protein
LVGAKKNGTCRSVLSRYELHYTKYSAHCA